MTHQTHASPPVEEDDERWIIFAAVLFIALAIGDVIWGVTALSSDDHFDADGLLLSDLSTWGAVHLGWGVLQGLTAVLLIRGSAVGLVLGALLALVHGTAVLASIGAYPLWSAVLLALDGLVIYGLVVHGANAMTITKEAS